tara:strand:- start:1324 stop:4362 length:3039 start_codon:yes stop_codon:yes gene_type:complete
MAEEVTLIDGTRVRVPEGLSDGELNNYIAKAFPNKAAEFGVTYDLEREYNIESGVGDFSARFGAALADGNPEEIKAEFDNTFGKGNWGFTDFGNEPYVTADGLRAIGKEPEDERKVLLRGTKMSVYNLVDIIPEAVVGGATVAAELLPVPGTGVVGSTVARGMLSSLAGRGLLARSTRAGIGDASANVGLEGVQSIRGTQRESLGEVLQEAGTEGLIVGLGSVVLGAPFSAAGGVANRVRAASKDMAPGTQGVNNVDLTQMLEAQARVASQVGEKDAMLLSLRTLIGDQGLMAGNIMTKIEGIGTKQLGDEFAKRTLAFMNKYRSIALESKRLGDPELTTLAKLKSQLSKSEQKFAIDIMENLQNFNKTTLGKIDKAATTLRGAKDFAEKKLLQQYRVGMKAFGGDEFYGQFKDIGGRTLSNTELAKFVQKISDDSGISVDDVVNSFDGRVTSRIKVQENGKVAPAFLTEAQKKLKIQAAKRGETYNPYSGADISPQDLLNYDMAIRKRAYDKKANLAIARKNLEISKAAQSQIGKLPGIDPRFKSKLAKVNRQYSQFADIYRGKNGLFNQIAERPTNDTQAFLKGFVSGKEGAEFSTLMDKLDRAYGSKAIGASDADALGIQTKQEILGTFGVNYIRESKIDVENAFKASPEAGARAAQAALNKLNSVEATILKGTTPTKAKKAMKEIFSLASIDEYKTLLKQMATGTPQSAQKAAAKLGTVLSFREAATFVEKMADVGSNLSKNNLDEVVSQLKSLEALDKRSGDFYRDLLFSENWGRVISASNAETAGQKNAGIKAWADDWIDARSGQNGVANMQELFGKEMYESMDDLALNIRGALNIDPNAGALSVAEQPVSLVRRIIRGDLPGALKPLSFMYGTRALAPGSKSWTRLNKMITEGKSIDDIAKSQSGLGSSVIKNARKASEAALSGRTGLFAASVSAYMEDAHQTYPTEDEVPVVAPVEEQPEDQPEQQSMVPTDTGLAAIQQIASMIQGAGTSGLEEGADIARSVA